MLRLRPYKSDDANTIVNWFDNEYAFHLWCADRYDHYPISAKDMNDYYAKDTSGNSFAMCAFDETGIVGHIYMRYKDTINAIHFGFIVVDNSKRGKGYGKEMLTLAIEYAFTILKVNTITLGVFAQNEAAIRCYQTCGFNIINDQDTMECMNETWKCYDMELKKWEKL